MAQSRFVRWSQRVLTVVAAFGLVYLFLVMIQPYRNQMFLAEKRGRVVDAVTGEGLAGVAVVMNYQSIFIAPFRTSSGCIHQKIVRTNADGFYVVPDASKDIDVADGMLQRMLPGFSEKFGWSLSYYKEGYMRKDDIDRYVQAIENGRHPDSVSRVMSPARDGAAYVLPPVELKMASSLNDDLAADVYLTYVRHLSNGLWCFAYSEGHSKELVALQNEIKAQARKLVCDLPPESVLTPIAKQYSFADCASTIAIQRIKERRGGNREGMPSTAGEMCESYRYVPTEYECQEGRLRFPPLRVVSSRVDETRTGYPLRLMQGPDGVRRNLEM